MAEVRIVKPGEARPWWWQGGIVRWLATGADTEERYACEEGLIQPGHGPAPHIQTRARECLYVLSGGPLEFTAGRHEIPLETGGFVSVPRGTAHVFRNPGEEPARILLWCFPAAFDRFQLEAGEEPQDLEHPRKATDADRRRMLEVAPKYGIEMNPDQAAFEQEPDVRAVAAGQDQPHPIAGNVWTTLASGGHTGGDFSMYAIAVAPGTPPPQVFDVDTTLYVVQGTLGLELPARTVEAAPGTLVQIPAGTRHSLWGTADRRGEILIWSAPATDLPAQTRPP